MKSNGGLLRRGETGVPGENLSERGESIFTIGFVHQDRRQPSSSQQNSKLLETQQQKDMVHKNMVVFFYSSLFL